MTQRATKRGEERTSLEGTVVDVLVCGASFAGLAAARALAGHGLDVLVLDRYAIGERQTSACAIPTGWLDALGLQAAARQELPCMTFTTPHGSVTYRLPWSWTAFDYRALCQALWAQAGDARFDTAKVERRTADGVLTDRGEVRAPLVIDALGWRRVLDPAQDPQPPRAPISRGLESHPQHDGSGDALDVWVRRDVVRYGYGWRVPAGDEARIGVGSYEPRHHVRRPTDALTRELGAEPSRYQGNWFPHRLRPPHDGRTFFAGDSAGHCYPLSGEGIRTALLFGGLAGTLAADVAHGRRTHADALAAYARRHERIAPSFRRASRLQWLVPRLPPRALTVALKVIERRWLTDRAFGWYLDQAHPAEVAQ